MHSKHCNIPIPRDADNNSPIVGHYPSAQSPDPRHNLHVDPSPAHRSDPWDASTTSLRKLRINACHDNYACGQEVGSQFGRLQPWTIFFFNSHLKASLLLERGRVSAWIYADTMSMFGTLKYGPDSALSMHAHVPSPVPCQLLNVRSTNHSTPIIVC